VSAISGGTVKKNKTKIIKNKKTTRNSTRAEPIVHPVSCLLARARNPCTYSCDFIRAVKLYVKITYFPLTLISIDFGAVLTLFLSP
jgi:hypothetical protein